MGVWDYTQGRRGDRYALRGTLAPCSRSTRLRLAAWVPVRRRGPDASAWGCGCACRELGGSGGGAVGREARRAGRPVATGGLGGVGAAGMTGVAREARGVARSAGA